MRKELSQGRLGWRARFFSSMRLPSRTKGHKRPPFLQEEMGVLTGRNSQDTGGGHNLILGTRSWRYVGAAGRKLFILKSDFSLGQLL